MTGGRVVVHFGEFALELERAASSGVGAKRCPWCPRPSSSSICSCSNARLPSLEGADPRPALAEDLRLGVDRSPAWSWTSRRPALGDKARKPLYVRTVHGLGYAFCGTASERPRAGTAPARTRPSPSPLRLVWGDRAIPLSEGENVLGTGAGRRPGSIPPPFHAVMRASSCPERGPRSRTWGARTEPLSAGRGCLLVGSAVGWRRDQAGTRAHDFQRACGHGLHPDGHRGVTKPRRPAPPLPAGSAARAVRDPGSLGAGGMGEVYRARDIAPGARRGGQGPAGAVSPDPERLRRFEQEARAAGALNHPDILAVYDVGHDEGAPYVVSELLEGETLRERLGRGRAARAQGHRVRGADRPRPGRRPRARASSTGT